MQLFPLLLIGVLLMADGGFGRGEGGLMGTGALAAQQGQVVAALLEPGALAGREPRAGGADDGLDRAQAGDDRRAASATAFALQPHCDVHRGARTDLVRKE